MDKSLAFIKLNCNVLGMGVAVSVSVSTLTLIFLSWSLTPTPNFCSSSIINSPKSLKIHLFQLIYGFQLKYQFYHFLTF
jgi:hypothetical protein